MNTRKHYLNLLKSFFHKNLYAARKARHLTQAKMAQILMMDERSYIKLEHGTSGCSALTLLLYLIYCCDDPTKLLEEMKTLIETAFDQVA